jgi:recombination associated protein RdgC
MKIRVLEETKKYLQESGQKRLYREQRERIREAVRTELLKNIPPVTAIYDVAINTTSGIVYVSFLTNKLIQEFMDIFKEAFGLRVKFFDLVSNEDLEKAGLSLMTVGREFMTWLWFKSQQRDGKIAMNGEDYAVNFVRRMALESGEGEMTETVVCSGVNFDLNEAKEALRQGKKVKDARLRIEKDGTAWEFGYKGDSFQFQSVKLPMSAEVEENETPEGRNLERLFMVSAMIDVMDELFKTFLRIRISTEWAQELSAMLAWAEESQE